MKYIVKYEIETLKDAIDAHNNDYDSFLDSEHEAIQMAENENLGPYTIYRIEVVE